MKIEPEDKDALQTKLFLLLQTEQYGAALSLTDSNETYSFEKAYSLYRTNQEDDALKSLEVTKKNKGDDDRGVLHLEAQLVRDRRNTSWDVYSISANTGVPRGLISSCIRSIYSTTGHLGSGMSCASVASIMRADWLQSSEEHADILTNLEAAQKHLDFIDSGHLRALDELPTSISNNLESAPPPQPPSAAATVTSAIALQETNVSKKEKSVRLKRVPKGVVLGVTPLPDPERWLKKSERSTFGTGGKRRKAGGGATQGSVESAPPAPSQGSKSAGKGKKKK